MRLSKSPEMQDDLEVESIAQLRPGAAALEKQQQQTGPNAGCVSGSISFSLGWLRV